MEAETVEEAGEEAAVDEAQKAVEEAEEAEQAHDC